MMVRAARLGVLLLVGLLAGCAGSPAAPGSGGRTGIVARGEGTVSGSPDTATLVLGVQTRGPSAKAALDANTAPANALLTVLRNRGVAEKDLRTSELSITPTSDGVGRITGYQVSNIMTATVRDVPAAGGIIDAAAGAAGDALRVRQLSFSIADDSVLRTEARSAAVRRAQANARQMAEAAGVTLGPLLSVTEVPPGTPSPYPAQAAPREASDVPVQPGDQELRVAVDLVYGISS